MSPSVVPNMAPSHERITHFESLLDTIISGADREAIVQTVNQVNPGQARYLESDGMAHDFAIGDKFDEQLISTALNWMNELLAAK